MIFIKTPKSMERYDSYNGYSESSGYYFPLSVCFLCNIKTPEGLEKSITVNGKIYESKDIKTNILKNSIIKISRKNILRAEERWKRLMNRKFLCMRCGEIHPITEIICKGKNKFHYEHYWCEQGIVKELKNNCSFIVYSKYKGTGGQRFKEKISLKNNQVKRQLIEIVDDNYAHRYDSFWREKYIKYKKENL